jgi:uncharacterized protein (TIGR02145 family)
MAQNLRTTKKPDGSDITTGRYGAYYTWSTAMNNQAAATGVGAQIQGICPEGWHIPSDFGLSASDDWQKLSNFLGGNAVAGGHMKAGSFGGDNSSEFAAVATGYWDSGTLISNSSTHTYFWSSTQYSNISYAMSRWLYHLNLPLYSDFYPKTQTGRSIRCIKD